ncbi:helix-turn-helix domain-containing protein [Lysinibacillus sp. NPDC093712]|uniref:helix-turn-helix domain-containing protein n=1 Tax=Lysinibacillus sp. NPDC093712 TaxID=3390579 RepID=UPI003D085008
MSISRFSNNIKYLRKTKNLTQKDFANILGLAESTIGMYERDERQPSLDVLIDICTKFNVSSDFILGIETDRRTVNNHDDEIKELTLKFIDELSKLTNEMD